MAIDLENAYSSINSHVKVEIPRTTTSEAVSFIRIVLDYLSLCAEV